MKNIARFVELEKVGQKFIVKQIYDTPQDKLDKRVSGNRSVYVTLIESLLLNYFIKQDKIRLNFTKNQLWEILGLCNKNMKYGYGNNLFSRFVQREDSRANKFLIDRAFKNARQKLTEVINSALKSLSRRKLIQYEYQTVAVTDSKTFVVTEDWQIEKILKCKREAIDELVGKTIVDRYTKKKRPTEERDVYYNPDKNITPEKYYKLLNKKLYKLLGFKYIYRRYSIVCLREYLERGLQENEEILKQSVNKKIIDSISRKAEKEFEKNRENLKNKKTTFVLPNYYVDIQKIITKKILNLDEKLLPEFEEYLKKEQEMEQLAEELFG